MDVNNDHKITEICFLLEQIHLEIFGLILGPILGLILRLILQ